MHSTEAAMDAYIAAAAAQLRDMVDRGAQDGLAFLLQDEVRGIPSLAGHTVLALKAPPGTTLEVPGARAWVVAFVVCLLSSPWEYRRP